MSQGVYIFYEGPNDRDFVDKILTPLLEPKYGANITPQHATVMEMRARAEAIRYVKSRDLDYIYITDLDDIIDCPIKKKDVISRSLKEKGDSRVVIVCHEIESWYYAGLGESGCLKLKVPYIRNTSNMTKEEFYEHGRKAGFSTKILFRRRVMSEFKACNAIRCNESFRHLHSNYLS